MKLDEEFYCLPDVVTVARLLLGKVLFSKIIGQLTVGIITETEAYNGIADKASHAFGGRCTGRTEVMYSKGGHAYIYLCYGIHSLFNVATGRAGIPHAVLIRSIVPFAGEKLMISRRNAFTPKLNLYNGPGKVCSAPVIHHSLTGVSLLGNKLWIEDRGISFKDAEILVTPRIGVEYAGNDALLPYRFEVNNNVR